MMRLRANFARGPRIPHDNFYLDKICRFIFAHDHDTKTRLESVAQSNGFSSRGRNDTAFLIPLLIFLSSFLPFLWAQDRYLYNKQSVVGIWMEINLQTNDYFCIKRTMNLIFL